MPIIGTRGGEFNYLSGVDYDGIIGFGGWKRPVGFSVSGHEREVL